MLSWVVASLLVFCVFTGFAESSSESRPPWLKEGVYARYEFPSGGIGFSNGTWTHVPFQAVFQWECLDVKGNVAELNVSLSLNETRLSALVYVDLTSREVTLLNGTYLGKTMLWLPANPEQDELVELNRNQTARVQVHTQTYTCQGLQGFFEAEGENPSIGGSYDLDTGVLIWTGLEYEPELLAFGIIDLGSSGITATNIDLGPREWLFEILTYIPFILPIIAFLIVFVLLFRRRQQKKRQKRLLTKTLKHSFLRFFREQKLLSHIVALLLVFCVFTGFAESSSESRPAWFKEGVYARYEFPSGRIILLNGTWNHSKNQAVFQWECVDVEVDVAELNVSISFNKTQLSTLVYVDLTSRDVTFPNGTNLGKTALWLPANPARDEQVELKNNATARVEVWDGMGGMSTCQGIQRSFVVLGDGYDLDTGVLIQSGFGHEPALLAFGIVDPGYHGSSGITGTNIDLGPREWLPEILESLPLILPVAAFIAVFALLYRRRQQKKRQKKTLARRNRNHTDSS